MKLIPKGSITRGYTKRVRQKMGRTKKGRFITKPLTKHNIREYVNNGENNHHSTGQTLLLLKHNRHILKQHMVDSAKALLREPPRPRSSQWRDAVRHSRLVLGLPQQKKKKKRSKKTKKQKKRK